MKKLFLLLVLAAITLGWIQGRHQNENAGGVQVIRLMRTNIVPAKTALTQSAVPSVSLAQDAPWQALKEGKYRDAISFLRACGCPGETIRDLIFMQLSRKAYAQLRTFENQHYLTKQWWRTVEDPITFSAERSQMASIARKTRNDQLYALFGATMDEFSALSGGAFEYSYIPREKRRALEEIENRYIYQKNEIDFALAKMPWDDDLRSRRQTLEKDNRAALVALLTQAELEDYDVRDSAAASFVRSELPPAQSEADFRTMVKAATRLGAEQPDPTANDYDAKAAQGKKQALIAQIKASLSPDALAAQEAAQRQAESDRQAEVGAEMGKMMSTVAQSMGVDPALGQQFAKRLLALQPEMEAKYGKSNGSSTMQTEAAQKEIWERINKIAIELMGDKGPEFLTRMTNAATAPSR